MRASNGTNPGAQTMDLKPRQLILVSVMLLGSCVAYVPAYVPAVSQATTQQRFDRSWAAATGAMSDEGLTITSLDRGAGMIRGQRGSITITTTLETLADGSVQVKFASKGDDRADPGLVHRVSDSFDRRMAR
jgi:hypothetical protein